MSLFRSLDFRWDKNWITHLDGMFQTFDRVGDHYVHVARGMGRLVVCDTMANVEPGYLGEPSAHEPLQVPQTSLFNSVFNWERSDFAAWSDIILAASDSRFETLYSPCQ